jgi:hypothetical protein
MMKNELNIYKRIDTLHKSIIRKLSLFTIVILNIYFTKLWGLFISIFDKLAVWVEHLFEGKNQIFDFTFMAELISYTVYGSALGIAIFIVFSGIYFSLFELSDIKKLNIELKKYDLHYHIKLREIDEDPLFKKIELFVQKYTK